MPRIGTPRSKTASGALGAAASVVEAGPPDRMIALGATPRIAASSAVHGRISEYTPASRTRLAISWVYWEPKSRIRTRSITDMKAQADQWRMEIYAAPSRRLRLPGAGCFAAHQHAFDAQVLVDFGPVHAKRGQLVVRALLRRSIEQTRVPPEQRHNFLPVGQGDDQLCIRARGVPGLHRFKLL